MKKADFVIIGGGVIGIATARELRTRFPKAGIIVLEKEPACGLHASGRNSGVLHAGFYYTADSLKAKFTRDGNRLLTAYCEQKQIPLHRCGKLVVARNAEDLPQMDELLRRGQKNGVPLEAITEAEAKKIEPRVKTYQRAIFSPTTSTADPTQVLAVMREDATREKIEVINNAKFLGRKGEVIRTTAGEFAADYLINAAGLYADVVAREYGFSEKYRILPFKGLYLYSEEPLGSLKTNIYPVPNLGNPFLGVHFTVRNDGKIKIGPTAIPAFWREQYTGLGNFSAAEFAEIIWRQTGLMWSSNFDFKRLAWEEIQKYSRPHLVQLAADLLEGVKLEDYRVWGKPGIRAQLLDVKARKLEMDFVVESDARSLHILNAVSPAWTCSMPVAKFVCDRICGHLKSSP